MRDNKKKRNLASKDDVFRILDAIEVLKFDKNDKKTLYVTKKSYKLAKKILKMEDKDSFIKIKTY